MDIFQKDIFGGKSVVVTGGGSGIGKRASHRFLELGATVTICGRNQEKLDATTQEFKVFIILVQNIGFSKIHAAVCDIRKPEDVERFVKFALDKMGRIDILVYGHSYPRNNAGGQFFSPAVNISNKG